MLSDVYLGGLIESCVISENGEVRSVDRMDTIFVETKRENIFEGGEKICLLDIGTILRLIKTITQETIAATITETNLKMRFKGLSVRFALTTPDAISTNVEEEPDFEKCETIKISKAQIEKILELIGIFKTTIVTFFVNKDGELTISNFEKEQSEWSIPLGKNGKAKPVSVYGHIDFIKPVFERLKTENECSIGVTSETIIFENSNARWVISGLPKLD